MKNADSKHEQEQAQAFRAENETHGGGRELSGVTAPYELSEKDWEEKTAKADRVQTRAFMMNRYFSRNKGESEKSLFETLREQEKNAKDGIIIKEPPRGVSLLTLKRINYALAKRLYNTSYRLHNTQQNTGLIIDNKTQEGETVKPMEVEFLKLDATGTVLKDSKGNNIVESRKSYSYSEIEFTLTGLTADVFGLGKRVKPTNQQKKIVRETLSAMQQGTKIILPNKDELTKSLLWLKDTYKRAADGAVFYDVLLSPLYAMEIEQGAAAHPQDISQRMARIEKQTTADWDLLGLLGEQMEDSYKIRKSLLLQRLGMWEDYKKNKSRMNEKLNTLFSNMKSQGAGKLLDSAPDGGANPVETTGADGELMYIFYFNPDYIPKEKHSRRAGGKDKQNEQEEA